MAMYQMLFKSNHKTRAYSTDRQDHTAYCKSQKNKVGSTFLCVISLLLFLVFLHLLVVVVGLIGGALPNNM